MSKFKIPSIPSTVNKTIRFPNNIVEDVENAIKGNKVKVLKDLIKKGTNDPILVDNVLTCAREYFDGLSNEMVDLIQEATGVDLRIE